MTFSTTELVTRYLNTYREQARKYGYEADAATSSAGPRPIYVAETDERAKAEAGRGDRDALQQLPAHDVGDADPARLHVAVTRPRISSRCGDHGDRGSPMTADS